VSVGSIFVTVDLKELSECADEPGEAALRVICSMELCRGRCWSGRLRLVARGDECKSLASAPSSPCP
jgi:hypothetical protein